MTARAGQPDKYLCTHEVGTAHPRGRPLDKRNWAHNRAIEKLRVSGVMWPYVALSGRRVDWAWIPVPPFFAFSMAPPGGACVNQRAASLPSRHPHHGTAQNVEQPRRENGAQEM